ncbi:MAG: site-specific DNA-methyltransferase [Patescibacteria group bacterium]|nr:site-specific DNA-methyltransferase [Patescibacteria group bacterium]
MSPRVEQIGDCTLRLGDCREILPTLGAIDAVVTDPPYGQKYKVNTFYRGGSRENLVVQRNGGKLLVRPNTYDPIVGDNVPFDPSHLLSLAPELLIFGAHKFADRLPPGGWLIWDKVPTGKVRDQGDGEAAWINRDQPMRIFRLLWDGICVGAAARHEVTAGQKRYHPSQKPEALMIWCLGFIRGKSILDPYMGAGATAVAAVACDRKFTGIEIDPKYFDIACSRVDAAMRQPRLFTTEPDKSSRQEALW